MRRTPKELAIAAVWCLCALIGLLYGLYAAFVLERGQPEKPFMVLLASYVFCRGTAEFIRLGWPDPPGP